MLGGKLGSGKPAKSSCCIIVYRLARSNLSSYFLESKSFFYF